MRKKTSLDIVKTKENNFLNINIEEIVREAEETLEEETEGADVFGSDDSEDSDDYNDSESEDDE